MTTRWTRRPEGSNWGDFGPDDQIGRLNYLTAEKVRDAAREVREGLVFSLSLPLDYPGGNVLNANRLPPILRPGLRDGDVNMNYEFRKKHADSKDVLSDDLAILHLQYSTQWDALSHVGSRFDVDGTGVEKPVYYNGFAAGEDVLGPASTEDCGLSGNVGMSSTSNAKALGIENMAAVGVQGVGVMVDLRHHLGDERTAVGYDQLMRILEADDVSVEKGDMVCFHTGLADRILGMRKRPDPAMLAGSCAVLDGNDSRLLNWITDTGLATIAADNYAVEDFPSRLPNASCSILPLHHHCLFKLGIHLGELWHLTPLAAWLRNAGRSRFYLSAPPLRLPGAVGSPVSPVAVV